MAFWQDSKHKATLGFAALTALMLAIGTFTFTLPARQMERGQWVSHAQRVIDQLETLESHIALFPQDKSIPADPARHMRMDFQRIDALIVDPAQKVRIAELRDRLDANVPTRVLREKLTTLLAEEHRLLDERSERWKGTALRTRVILATSTLLVYLFILVTYTIIRRESIARRDLLEIEQRAAAQQREVVDRLAKVVEIQREVAAEKQDLNALLQTICERTQRVVGGDGGVIEIYDEGDMVYRAATGIVAPYVGMRIRAQGSMSGLCVQQNATMLCNDSEMDPRVDRDACRKVGLRSMLLVPLTHKGKAMGVLKIASEKPYAFSMGNISTLEMMAAVLSATLSDAEANNALQQANVLLESLATTDGLTGLKNNRFFKERLAEEFSRAVRYKVPLSVVLMDVDHFKQFNDTYGHVAGDDVLREVGTLMKRAARLTDCVARYGGEEFALILPQTDAPGATIIADRIREIIEGNSWPRRAITVSVGVSTIHETMEEGGELVEAADQALYLSKSGGRNCVTHSDAACPIPAKPALKA